MNINICKVLENRPSIQDEDGYYYTVVDWTAMNMIVSDPHFVPVIYGGNITAPLGDSSKGFAIFGIERNGTVLKSRYRVAVQIGGE